MTRRPLVAGNWKMNGLRAALAEIIATGAGYDAALKARAELVVCPPATLMALAAGIAESAGLGLGGQDCHTAANGAHTGDLSAAMLKDAGATYVIVGHSERRADHGETDALVQAKAHAALAAGLTPIVCVGETRAEREAGRAEDIVGAQIMASLPADAPGSLVVAYEPVWAIGTGRTPTLPEIAQVHAEIRARLTARFGAAASGFRLLYGGSVKPSNAAEIFALPNVDGALVGGASLKAADFGGIITALDAA